MYHLTPLSQCLLNSALASESVEGTLDDCIAWHKSILAETVCNIEKIDLLQCSKWYADIGGNIRHESGKFFSIEGIDVQTNVGRITHWKQPIIVQPEVGILGILTQMRGEILHFLMQAKIEPGNVNIVQISPTVQATRSNYTQVHGGKRTPYLDYFLQLDKVEILVDQLQSEQGARFFKKRNRNMIIRIREEEKILCAHNFRWMTLAQIKAFLKMDNMVNMDTRTVLACTQLRQEHHE